MYNSCVDYDPRPEPDLVQFKTSKQISVDRKPMEHHPNNERMLRSRRFWKFASCGLAVLVILLILTRIRHQKIEGMDSNIIVASEIWEDKEIRQNQVVNFTQFEYTIKSNSCRNFDRELLGVIIVTSYIGHDELRSAHRQAISQVKLNEMGLLRVFLLAERPNREKFIRQEQIVDESHKFKDIVQGNFVEAYRNLTYKHIMGLKWASLECQKAKFIVKVDDDTVFDIFYLKRYLESLEIEGKANTNFLAGYVLDNKKPIRLSVNKWYVTRQEYAEDLYPDYLSGWLYITNPATALLLILQSQQEPFFWIDDTYVTGILRHKAGVPIIRLNKWFSANAEFLDCCIRDLKNSQFECEYFVGPNGGDSKLITEFLHNVEKCYFDECVKRPPEKSLKATCVASAKTLLQDHGEALVREVHLR